jgi:N-acetylmuramoyl-L-alanine amidase
VKDYVPCESNHKEGFILSFKQKQAIKEDFIAIDTKRRSGDKLEKVRFIVAHDTGNEESTARNNVDYYKRSAKEMSASAHIFTDDKESILCVPLDEKAWHVIYEVPEDNRRYGDDANDEAIGVELCYFKDKARSLKAYQNYVHVMAYLCHKYKLDPLKDIVGHETLDPKRKTDPTNSFKRIGKTFAIFLQDVVAEIKECTTVPAPVKTAPVKTPVGNKPKSIGKLTILVNDLNVRARPINGKVVEQLDKNAVVNVYGVEPKSQWYILNPEGTKFITNNAKYVSFKK